MHRPAGPAGELIHQLRNRRWRRDIGSVSAIRFHSCVRETAKSWAFSVLYLSYSSLRAEAVAARRVVVAVVLPAEVERCRRVRWRQVSSR